MLRYLSYELEKPNSVLIVFGFSFADEHILNLVKRSLTNPSLQIYIFCFNEIELKRLGKIFEKYHNVGCVSNGDSLDFTTFNTDFFSIEEKSNLKKEENISSVGPEEGQ